jgi:Zn-dependent peptidase ImmA (M78 family)
MPSAQLNPETQAKSLLSKHKLDQRLPIDVEALAKSLGILVRYQPFAEDLSGVLVKEQSQTVIGVNSSQAITRQRFTIAHELGHYTLGHEGEVFVDKMLRHQAVVIRRDGKSSLGQDLYEIQANQFAAELLMPRELLVRQVSKRLDKKPNVSSAELVMDLARAFLVSTQAMEYRLTNLGSMILS